MTAELSIEDFTAKTPRRRDEDARSKKRDGERNREMKKY
jgi:hypothetical protein